MSLDPSNITFNNALEAALMTNTNLFVTGEAGTGKTTFLKQFKEQTSKKYAIVAPTGVAAVQAGGQTIHSFFRIPFSILLPHDRRLRTHVPADDSDKTSIFTTFEYNKSRIELLKNLDVLIIDEVSMVRADILDLIDKLLRTFRKRFEQPFGGVQVILVGDPFQLSPVVRYQARDILQKVYRAEQFYYAKIFEKAEFQLVELERIYRQTDEAFTAILGRIRVGEVRSTDMEMLNRSVIQRTVGIDLDSSVVLSTHNNTVNEINRHHLQKVEGETFTFTGRLSGNFKENECRTSIELELKVGARVMILKNDSGANPAYVNGSLGKVLSLDNKEIIVELDNGSEVSLCQHTWEKIVYEWNEEKNTSEERVVGSFTQFPIALGWAMTIHKCQGMTFERVVLDVRDAFATGQTYVALSRCVSLDGLSLLHPILRSSVLVSQDAITFMERQKLVRFDDPHEGIKALEENALKRLKPDINTRQDLISRVLFGEGRN